MQLRAVSRYYQRGLQDFFTRRVLLIALFPFALVLALFAGELAVSIVWLLPWLGAQFRWLEGEIATVVVNILLGLGLAGFFAIINILLAVTLIGVFFTEELVAHVNDKYYRRKLAPFGTNWLIVGYSLMAFFKFLALFLLLSPLYLIPAVNLVAFAIPPFLYFKGSVVFDVGSQSVSRQEYSDTLAHQNKTLYLMTIPLYLLSYLPVIGIFSYIYAFLVMAHFFLDRQPA